MLYDCLCRRCEKEKHLCTCTIEEKCDFHDRNYLSGGNVLLSKLVDKIIGEANNNRLIEIKPLISVLTDVMAEVGTMDGEAILTPDELSIYVWGCIVGAITSQADRTFNTQVKTLIEKALGVKQ
jgi:hypothetical protein